MSTDKYACCCGSDHKEYEGSMSLQFVRLLIDEDGPNVILHVIGQPAGYVVPRMYIATHGINTKDLPKLAKKYGWKRG